MVLIIKKSIGFPKCLGTSLILEINTCSLALQSFMTSVDGIISNPLFFMSISACFFVRFTRASQQI